MEPYQIHLSDLSRILIGDVPLVYYLELVLRTVFIYLLLIVSMRLLGKRMAGQIGRIELAGLVSLAAAIGVPLQSPDRGLLPAIVIAFVLLGLSWLVAWLSVKFPQFERRSQGNIGLLVKNGVMHQKELHDVRVSRERLFAELRGHGIRHLGEVKRLYFEAGGNFTLIRQEAPGPGLSVIPTWDHEYSERQQKSTDVSVCSSCGNSKEPQDTACQNCGKDAFTPAIC